MTATWRSLDDVKLDPPASPPGLERTIEDVLIPRLLLAHCPPPMPSPSERPERAVADADLDEFVGHLRGVDDQAAVAHVRALLKAGVRPETLMLDLLAPAARRMGDLWDNDRCDFVAVTLALGRIQRTLHEVSATRPLRGTGQARPITGTVLLAGVDGEQHLLGLLIAAEFFARDEWEVVLGPPVAHRLVAEEVQRHDIDIVGFSLGSARRLEELAATIAEVRRHSRNPGLRILVGGPGVEDDAEAARAIGADAVSCDARTAPALARTLLAPLPKGPVA
jgi:methanogenic corrinoid protein MtbC1